MDIIQFPAREGSRERGRGKGMETEGDERDRKRGMKTVCNLLLQICACVSSFKISKTTL